MDIDDVMLEVIKRVCHERDIVYRRGLVMMQLFKERAEQYRNKNTQDAPLLEVTPTKVISRPPTPGAF